MKIKLLHILTELQLTNGVTSYVMNHYERLDHDKFSVDFLITKGADIKFVEMIESYGDKIIQAPRLSLSNYIKFVKHAKEVFKKNHYDIVHSHEFNWAMPYVKEAKKQNVEVRIFHAHSTKSSQKLIKKIRNGLLIPNTIRSSNQLWACSQIAGESFFKKKPFYLSYNAINPEKFKFNKTFRKEIREELGYSDSTKLLGFFGRFSEEKNTLHLLNVMKEVIKTRDDIKLLLIGRGPLQEEIFKVIQEEHLENSVTVLESKADINRYYSAIDLFMLPSFYEGLPVVGVESLFSNLPQLYSNSINKELNILNTISYLELKAPLSEWVEKIIELTDKPVDRTKVDLDKLSRFDIAKQAKVIENKYLELLKK